MDTLSPDVNWRATYPNPCQPGSSWPGLECKQLHVTRLDFGTPPNPTCTPSPTFPSQIFQLPHLQSIFIFNCFTHTPTTISLPPSLATSPPLQQLSLRSNPALVGPIPPHLSSLRSLQILTLSQNRLTGRLPPQILGLPSLLHLDLSYNTLTGPIPIEVGGLRRLVGLDLSYNGLSGPIPSSIGDLRALQKLDLSSNSLTGTIPNTIEHLQSLNFLALSNNRLRGVFPGPGLTGLRNLQYFLMDDNPMFVPLPVGLGQLRKLQELRLSNSGYSGEIPAAYSQLMNLSSLSLQNNRLSGRIPSGFANMSHIYHLNLSRNFLDGVVPFDLGFFKRLGRNLDLSGNHGLCLSPSEVVVNNIGVGVCGDSKSGSIMIMFMCASRIVLLFLVLLVLAN
ncbi:protein too many mouths [Phtheirospermum japonicum]|uniref:Protein too many mouths n=1 Tax=Phtheirospermum japonicum TaxID=374723 RepID=A0A830BWR1_9LAMI|nr:protein too many mouths [Phtheirospermum japonicum]